MKTKLINFAQNCWQMLTEVPGWPDAPKKIRIRRSLPIVIPCTLILLIVLWNKGVRAPSIASEREANQALIAQQKEVESLSLAISEEQAGELSARTAQAQKQTVSDSKELAPLLENMKQQAAKKLWEGNFQPSNLSSTDDVPPPDSLIFFLPARAKITASAGNKAAFVSLLALLDQFSSAEKRIDLTQLGIRADEQGRYTADLSFRFVARTPHAKTP
ncbi:MAG: hypothetical protein ABI273_03545 [Lacunisphaera sp.]